MRRFLAKLIVKFAKFVTSGMNAERREDVMFSAARSLYSQSKIELETTKGTLIFDSSCKDAIQRAGTPGIEDKEPDTVDWVNSFPENACFWDIGANIGIYSLQAAQNSSVRVLGFEPASENYAAFNRNIELNNLMEEIQAYCIAFSESSVLSTLNMRNTGIGASMLGFGVEEDQFERPIGTKFRQGAFGLSVDDFVRIYAPPLPTHVKIDVDGLEPNILRGGIITFSMPNVKSMIIEVEQRAGSSRSQEIMDLMTDFGFVAKQKESQEFRNVIFERVN